MLKYGLIPCIVLLAFTIGCSNNNDESGENKTNPNTQPIHYETDQEQKDRLNYDEPSIGERGGYPQSEQEQVNDADYKGGYSDAFTNKEAILLSQELQNKKDIIQAQVAVTDKRIIVGVMQREHTDHFAVNKIESTIREILPNTEKEIIVYTDDIHWDRMKNLDARLKAKNRGDDLENIVEDFLNIKN
ncbi:YhcN/YlaJ family sporulation lipoprotein [Virgibacillus halodenitrificans]|uniref:YhcN/YlaJ family sporulation lipoprotein n=1 Tax=Virgibacillus halodenitrificans TaxID=1482 RepID=UPI0002F71C22|nr:YhcN/YlaJ family sporulation lipoprotein [Virgibacillus halodenitrificans]MCG1027919.1 YhcN/YlaJ family sporulation lipoprotein [Virgibacillus halodenitrificans]MCJ0930743.1 YhcN/YlaJ family sporulation lipoprotein [Virgibacillus halodenitrificans]MEC2159975.1 YhcN/YlaJ family sporulation lipoprotein [Virgibacillus halodenitrificans]MYL44920.1 hypothetical protein [Virgibacillus halodenitrificans]MYL56301.1 hypothetical protein [Virgibacillus halodenitrificans]